ncbi:MAG: hypothetical protein KGR26_09170 [Cyanobacteria bacterium REEB65]|nr:hypothetical protein [Cyanobacteria bacterium REEB65]
MFGTAEGPPKTLERSDLRRRPATEVARLVDSVLDRQELVRTESAKVRPALIRLLGRWIPRH